MASKVKDAVVWYQKKVRPACLSLIIAPGESVARCCCSFVSGSHTCKPRNCVFRLSWGGENQSFECSAHHFYLFKVMSGHLSEARAVLCVHLFRSSGIRSTAGWSSSPPPFTSQLTGSEPNLPDSGVYFRFQWKQGHPDEFLFCF